MNCCCCFKAKNYTKTWFLKISTSELLLFDGFLPFFTSETLILQVKLQDAQDKEILFLSSKRTLALLAFVCYLANFEMPTFKEAIYNFFPPLSTFSENSQLRDFLDRFKLVKARDGYLLGEEIPREKVWKGETQGNLSTSFANYSY